MDMTVRRCYRCQRTGKVSDMVMDASGNSLSCRPCAGLKPREMQARSQRGHLPQWLCQHCKYRFRAQSRKHCGYCGSGDVVSTSETAAAKLLNEVRDRD